MGSEPHHITTGSISTDTIRQDVAEHETATVAVIDAVAAITETDPIDLPPLYDAINPDALNALFDSTDKPNSSDLRVEFSYHGFTVIVEPGPQVTVQDR